MKVGVRTDLLGKEALGPAFLVHNEKNDRFHCL